MSLRDFSDSEMAILQKIVEDYKRRENRSTETDRLEFSPQASDVYAAKTPVTGIPAREGLVPGYAECDIYKMVEDTPQLPPVTLEAVTYPDSTPYTKYVYNLSTSPVTDDYIPIEKSKFGFWMPVAGGGGVACDFIRFRILEAFVDVTPRYALVDILSRPCGCTTVEEEIDETGTGTGETLIVYDMAGCDLIGPAADLVNRIGYAKYLLAEGNIDQLTGTGTETIDNCNWEIIKLCCPACD